ALADAAVVDLADGRDLRGGAGEEALVRQPELVARDAPLVHGDALLAGEGEDRVARDALEDRAREGRGHEGAALHDEDVLAAPLAEVAVGIEEDRLVIAAELGLALGEDRAGVLAHDLALRERDVDVVPREARDLGANALLERLVAEVGAPLPRHDRGA